MAGAGPAGRGGLYCFCCSALADAFWGCLIKRLQRGDSSFEGNYLNGYYIILSRRPGLAGIAVSKDSSHIISVLSGTSKDAHFILRCPC